MEVMMGQDLFSATVITGVDPVHEEPIFRFASELFETRGICLIQEDGAEAALGRSEAMARLYAPQKLFQLREIIEWKARESQRNGSQRCVIVGRAGCWPTQPEFDLCEDLVRREMHEVKRWGMFREIRVACFTPDRNIVLVRSGDDDN